MPCHATQCGCPDDAPVAPLCVWSTRRYIPYQLAYGAAGKPPKIPPAACLIFIMEIVKIDGKGTKPKEMVYPEWTADELALWLDKDEAACTSWREGRVAKWEGGDEKLKATYPSMEELTAWLDKTCLNSRDKSLWKRTRAAKKKAAADALGAEAAAELAAGPPKAAAEPPKLTAKEARALLTTAMDILKANKPRLAQIVAECDAAGAESAGMMKMVKLMPVVQELMGGTLQEAGFSTSDLMTVMMQIQACGAEDATIAADTAKLMKAVQGDLSDFV